MADEAWRIAQGLVEMSIPGAEALMDLVRKIELSGRVYRGEPSREDMEMVRKSVESVTPVTNLRYNQ